MAITTSTHSTEVSHLPLADSPSATRAYVSRDVRKLALAVVCLGALMVSFDRTMTTLALPGISADLGPNAASRLLSVYQLSTGCFLVAAGRLNDLFGLRKIFILGALVFSLSSLLCAFTSTPGLLALVRDVQALGGAIITVAPASLIAHSFLDPAQRARAFSVATAAGWTAQGIGPFVGGGILSSTHNWHRVFLVNLPIGFLLIILALISMPEVSSRSSQRRCYLTSAMLLTAVTLLGAYAITGLDGSGTSLPEELVILLTAGLLMIQLFSKEARTDTPFIPFALFRQGAFRRVCIVATLMGASVYMSYLAYPSYLQVSLQLNPLETACALLPLSIVPAALAGFSAHKIIVFLGVRGTTVLGLSVIAAGLVLLLRAPVNGHFPIDVFPSMALVGAGLGLAPVSLFLAAMESAPQESSGSASGLYTTCYIIGSGFGVTLQSGVASLYVTHLLKSNGRSAGALIGTTHVALALGALCALVATIIAASTPQK